MLPSALQPLKAHTPIVMPSLEGFPSENTTLDSPPAVLEGPFADFNNALGQSKGC